MLPGNIAKISSKAFISYSHVDEKALDRLHKHLVMLQRDGLLSMWTDQAVLAGTNINENINANINDSNIFLSLVSPDYLASNYCYDKEFKKALSLFREGKMRIVPIIIEPCDWLSSPLQDFSALPKDGKPVSEWTNQNLAYLDVATRLRKLLEVPINAQIQPVQQVDTVSSVSRRLRIKQDFDSIQVAEFADKAFATIQTYFQNSSLEIDSIGDTLKAQFEIMDPTAFTCTVVNRAKRGNGEAHITVRNTKGSGFFGNINYLFKRHSEDRNSSNGGIRVEHDDYNLYLTLMNMNSGQSSKLSPEQVAEQLWSNFVKQAGIEYD